MELFPRPTSNATRLLLCVSVGKCVCVVVYPGCVSRLFVVCVVCVCVSFVCVCVCVCVSVFVCVCVGHLGISISLCPAV